MVKFSGGRVDDAVGEGDNNGCSDLVPTYLQFFAGNFLYESRDEPPSLLCQHVYYRPRHLHGTHDSNISTRMTSSRNILEADSVVVNFDGRSVVSNAYIRCHQNEIVGLLGRNGCGKSTLLNAIFGSLDPDHKTVRINGAWVPHGYEKSRVSFLPQSGMIPPNIRVIQAMDLFRVNQSKVREVAPQLIPLLDSRPGALSGGELKLAEIILVLFSESQFVLLDEPFSGLSPIAIEQVIDIMNVVKEDKGIIITDHLHRYVTSCSDRLYLMRNGSVVELKSARQLIDFGYINEP
jgi:ABC-type multidrug transport system ATPase subunit